MKKFSKVVALSLALSLPGGSIFPSVSCAEETKRIMNLEFHPLYLFFGLTWVNLGFKVSDRFTLGPSVANLTFNFLGSRYSGTVFGLNGTFYLSQPGAFKDGWDVSLETLFGANGTIIGSTIGYGWFWNNGINMYLGLGGMGASSSTSSMPVVPYLRYTMGVSF
ncbi:MAG: hypothetical protein JNL01_02910 [Bdellovibrionales bacterium]|nr:hypothetical protein [Bdellovibrionales bacterium]